MAMREEKFMLQVQDFCLQMTMTVQMKKPDSY